MNFAISEMLEQDCLYQTRRLTINSWISLEKETKLKEQFFGEVLEIMIPSVTKDLPDGWQNLSTIEQVKEWIEERKNDSYFYAIQMKEGKELIGFLFLNTENEKSDITELRLGYLLAEPFWGYGLGSELIKGLVDFCKKSKYVKSISGGVESHNFGSIRVLEKNGFVKSDEELPENMLLYKLNL